MGSGPLAAVAFIRRVKTKGGVAPRAGALRLRERRDEESLALARRLDREVGALAALGTGQVELLVGAERAAALAPVLRVAGVLDGELSRMLDAAAMGLRAALVHFEHEFVAHIEERRCPFH